MKNKLQIGIFIVFTILIGYILYTIHSQPKIVVVQSQEIVDHYEGLLEAKNKYEEEVTALDEKFEFQKKTFESQKRAYDSLQQGYSAKQRQEYLYNLEALRQKTYQLAASIKEKSEQKEDVLITGVFNKINDYVKRYGEFHNIELIIGTTESGNVIYVKDQIDVTQDILKGLNEEYRKGL